MDGRLWRADALHENSLLTNNQKYVIINYQMKEVLIMKNVMILILILAAIVGYVIKAKVLDEMIPDVDFE